MKRKVFTLKSEENCREYFVGLVHDGVVVGSDWEQQNVHTKDRNFSPIHPYSRLYMSCVAELIVFDLYVAIAKRQKHKQSSNKFIENNQISVLK